METLVSGATFWDFGTNKLFIGKYLVDKLVRDEDEKEGDGKKGDIMGFRFVDLNGEEHVIPGSSSIEKALSNPKVKKDSLIGILFKGKEIIKGTNKSFNRFDIKLFDNEDEARKYYEIL